MKLTSEIMINFYLSFIRSRPNTGASQTKIKFTYNVQRIANNKFLRNPFGVFRVRPYL